MFAIAKQSFFFEDISMTFAEYSQLLLYRTGWGQDFESGISEYQTDCTKHTVSCFCAGLKFSVRYVRILL